MINNYNRVNAYTPVSFKKARLRIPLPELCAREGADFAQKFKAAEETINHYRFWDLIVDKDGYKLAYKNTAKEYSITDKPKRHAKGNSLLIRTMCNAHKVQGKITSFKVEFSTMEEVRKMYKKIVNTKGLDRMLIIIKMLEEQAQKQYYEHLLKSKI